MKQLIILSGKGGTGKTSVAAALAHLASQELSLVMADADVDAANLDLLLAPTKLEEHAFMGGQVAVVDSALCTGCGACYDVCRFEAIIAPAPGQAQVPIIDRLACEGCAACVHRCPAQAIRTEEQQAGLWFRSQTRFGPLLHAHLFAGQENSGKLVTVVKQQARQAALDENRPLVIIDGPPGIGCPVISASAGADLALLVAEPTVSGTHDLERMLSTLSHFRVPALACVNKADLNEDRAKAIEEFCTVHGVENVGRLPYDDCVTEAMVHGQPVTVYRPDSGIAASMRTVWERVRERLGLEPSQEQLRHLPCMQSSPLTRPPKPRIVSP
jgi:MinD superfamily P-loop ATPase